MAAVPVIPEAEADAAITAVRLALCRLDSDKNAGAFRFTEATVWALCDLAIMAMIQAGQAQCRLTPEQIGEVASLPLDLDEWRDHVRASLQADLQLLTLAVLDPGEPG